MLNEISLDHILFIDVETVPQYPDYAALPDSKKKFWDYKASLLSKTEEQTSDKLYERAGIYSEFGKIICISSGYLKTKESGYEMIIKSYYSNDESSLLKNFSDMISKLSSSWYMCAHNGKEFDFPYICRRLLINGLNIPSLFDLAGKKPWEIKHIDTMELWKFGDYKSFVSLDLLADIFEIPSPKDDMDGSKVYEVYYKENNLERIKTYCEKDVLTLAKVFLKLRGENPEKLIAG